MMMILYAFFFFFALAVISWRIVKRRTKFSAEAKNKQQQKKTVSMKQGEKQQHSNQWRNKNEWMEQWQKLRDEEKKNEHNIELIIMMARKWNEKQRREWKEKQKKKKNRKKLTFISFMKWTHNNYKLYSIAIIVFGEWRAKYD